MSNLSWILNRFAAVADDVFLIDQDHSYRYSDLQLQIEAWQSELQRLEIGFGECVAVVGDYSPNLIFLFLALVLNRNIVVPLGRQSQSKQEEAFRVAGVTRWFEFDTQDKWQVYSVDASTKHPLLDNLRATQESGIVIFTSGTAGKSKAAVLQTSRLIEKYREIRRKPLRTMIFLKLDHIGGVNTLFSMLLHGGTIVTAGERTPRAVCETIEKHRVQLLPTTPTFLNMLVMAKAYENYDLSALQMISYGTEPMPQSTLEAVHAILPGVTLKQTYGLTELGIFSTQSRDSRSNWMKVGGWGVEMKIVDQTLWIRSRSAMLGYLNAPSPFDADGWYNTGDQVEVDGEYLRILGRQSEIINVGGEKVYPAEVESVLLELSNIKDVLVKGKSSPVTGQIVTATVVLETPEDVKELRKRIINHCKDRLLPYKIPALITISEQALAGERFKKIRNC